MQQQCGIASDRAKKLALQNKVVAD